jgi:hypothetical protein
MVYFRKPGSNTLQQFSVNRATDQTNKVIEKQGFIQDYMGVWGLVLTLSRKNKIGAAIKNAIETNDPQSINDLVGIDHSMYFKNYSKKHSYNPTFVFKAIAVLEPASIEDIDFYKTEKGLMAIHNNKTGEIAAVAPFMDVMELSSIGSDTFRKEKP